MAGVKRSIEDAIAYLNDHPDEVRYTDVAATATLGEKLRVTIEGGSDAVTTDMTDAVGGRAEHSSPGWLLRAAVASCVATAIGMEAARGDVALSELVVEVDSESDDRGVLHMADDVPTGPLSLSIRVHISGDGDAGVLEAVARRGAANSPASDAVQRSVPVEVDVAVA